MERERAGSKALSPGYLILAFWIMVRLGYFIFIVLQYSNSTEATYPAVVVFFQRWLRILEI